MVNFQIRVPETVGRGLLLELSFLIILLSVDQFLSNQLYRSFNMIILREFP